MARALASGPVDRTYGFFFDLQPHVSHIGALGLGTTVPYMNPPSHAGRRTVPGSRPPP